VKLSRQLFLLSLLTLALPWAGCQYLQEMESSLRQGQAKALQATAKAVAARLSSDPELRQKIQLRQSQGPSLYAHLLSRPIILDGYLDDWNGVGFDWQHFASGDFKARLKIGLTRKIPDNFANRSLAKLSQDQLYLFIQVEDNSIRYHHPGLAGLLNGDHLRLTLGKASYAIGTSSPGQVQAFYLAPGNGRRQREHRISGAWRETAKGYQIELGLPLSLSFNLNQHSLGLSIIDSDPHGQELNWLGNQHWSESPASLMLQDPNLDRAIAVFAMDGIQLSLANQQGWQIAHGQSSGNPNHQPQPSPVAKWLYQQLSGDPGLPSINKHRDGRISGDEVALAQAGIISTQWYQNGSSLQARSAVPIRGAQHLLGVVLAQQGGDIHISLLNSAFSRLLLYSIVASLVAGLGLLAYASWLSWRIRKLSQAADQALDDNGLITNLPASRAKDEIGDLSRSYNQLLERLQGYTDYLQTLASKLSHELRTPLAVVKGSLDNLQQEALSPEAKVYADRAQEGSHRLSAILNAMSAANRVEAAIRSAEPEHFPLDQLVQHVGAAYQATFKQANIKLSCQAQGNYYGAPELLVQLLDKLLENALDFCPADGEIELALRANEQYFILSLSNDGQLLPAHMQHQLFDSMVSVRQAASSDNGHLGLGLHIVRLIAEYHHGKVKAENRPDHSGVIFSLLLPKHP